MLYDSYLEYLSFLVCVACHHTETLDRFRNI